MELTLASGNVVAGNIVGTTSGRLTDRAIPVSTPWKWRRWNPGWCFDHPQHHRAAGAGNLVVANRNYGIEIRPRADFNTVSGNAVGTTLATGSRIGTGPPVNLGNHERWNLPEQRLGEHNRRGRQLDSQGLISLLMGGNVVSGNGQVGIDILGNDPVLRGNG